MYTLDRSPLRQHNRPAGGDRFIPTRSLMDMDYARSVFTHRTPVKKPEEERAFNLTPQEEEYRRRIEEHFRVDSEGKPRKILSFGTPNRTQKKLSFDHLFPNESQSTRPIKPPRQIPTTSNLMLDAPYIRNNPCLKLLDWGNQNIIAICLGLSVYLYNHATKATEHLLEASDSDDYPSSLAWSTDGCHLAVGFATSRIEIWDGIKLQHVGSVEEHKGRVGALSWNNNHLLSSGGRDGIIVNQDIRLKRAKATKFCAHKGEITSLTWSDDGARLASGGRDGAVRIWDRLFAARAAKPLHRLSHGSVRAVTWCPFKSHSLATGGAGGCVRFWNTQSGNCVSSFDTGREVGALEWNVHHKEILSAEENKMVLRSFPSMRKMADLRGHSERILNLSQSPDGTIVASASADESLRFWNVFGPPVKKDNGDESIFSLKRMHIR
ncbi:hypothetical protein LUZ60_011866 [Juncus effusus]|nr:hypothetical protein LUZ60_011866 [Juncus effusus]